MLIRINFLKVFKSNLSLGSIHNSSTDPVTVLHIILIIKNIEVWFAGLIFYY